MLRERGRLIAEMRSKSDSTSGSGGNSPSDLMSPSPVSSPPPGTWYHPGMSKESEISKFYSSIDTLENIEKFADAIGFHEALIGSETEMIVPIDEILPSSIIDSILLPPKPPVPVPRINRSSKDTSLSATIETAEVIVLKRRLNELLSEFPSWVLSEPTEGGFGIQKTEPIKPLEPMAPIQKIPPPSN